MEALTMHIPAARPKTAPRDMLIAPALPAIRSDVSVQRRLALFINPFYPKDPRASYGKHVDRKSVV